MRWAFRWRKELNTGQYYDLLKRGFIKPEDQEPQIEGLQFYLDAFRELSTSRPVGLGPQSIPFTAIAEYFRIYELQDDFDDFAHIIRQMDSAFLDLNADANKAGGKKDVSGNTNAKNNHKR